MAVRVAQRPAAASWQRANHAGRPVTLLEGPVVLAALTLGSLVESALGAPRPRVVAVVVAGLGAGLVGAYDDLDGGPQARGFRGHLAALRRGVVTTGAVKVAGVGLSAATASAVLVADRTRAVSVGSRGLDAVIDTALIALGANLVNLFDLRAGRSAKVVLLLATPLLGFGSGPLVGAAAGSLPTDLAQRSMLGDCGANALGAAAATVAAAALPRRGRLAALTAVLVLNGLSERVSFTEVIGATPVLAWLDGLGRRSEPSAADTGTHR